MAKLGDIWLGIFINALATGLLVTFLTFSNFVIFTRFNNLIYDFWLIHHSPAELTGKVAIIDIDEKSLDKIGQLPWPRTILADLISALIQDGAKGIGLDIWLTEPDRSSPIAVDNLLEKNFGLNLDFSQIPPIALDNDRYLRNIIANKPVVLGGLAEFSQEGNLEHQLPEDTRFQFSDGQKKEIETLHLPVAKGFISPIPLLAAAVPVGLLNVSLQNDGIVRKMPLLVKIGDAVYPGLSLLTLQTALGEEYPNVDIEDGVLRSINVGNTKIPVDKDGSIRPVYRGPARSLPYYSAVDILDGKIGRNELQGKILFIGSSAHSLLNYRATPYDAAMPGVEIHATILENIFASESIRAPEGEEVILLLTIFFTALAGAIIFRLLPFAIYSSFVVLCLAIFIGGSWILFQRGIFISPIAPLTTIFLSALFTLPFRFWREQSERWKLKQAFNHYVAPEVVSQIMDGGDALLEGEYKEISIMFTDVRGFTEISERLTPAQLVKLLNRYFTPMTALITARKGTLDKFIGDALMAFWNAPMKVPNHQLASVKAALEMQQALTVMRPALLQDFGVTMRMGIGIHSGMAHVGNMGSEDLLDYTCLGENVNIASRLESLCKRYGMNIIVSGAIYEACKEDQRMLLLDRIKVKGSAKTLEIYTPLDQEKNHKGAQEEWLEALELYFKGDFAQARIWFTKAQKDPFLAVACELFLERCVNLGAKKFNSWDGVWIYHEK